MSALAGQYKQGSQDSWATRTVIDSQSTKMDNKVNLASLSAELLDSVSEKKQRHIYARNTIPYPAGGFK